MDAQREVAIAGAAITAREPSPHGCAEHGVRERRLTTCHPPVASTASSTLVARIDALTAR